MYFNKAHCATCTSGKKVDVEVQSYYPHKLHCIITAKMYDGLRKETELLTDEYIVEA